MNLINLFFLILKFRFSLFPVVIIGLLISCQNQFQEADVVFINGKVVSVDEDFSIYSAVAVKGDKFIAVGTDDEIRKYAGDNTRVIDVENKTIIPGIIDAHAHPEAASISETYDGIPDVHTMEELLDWIERQASVKEDGEWIIHPKLFYTRLIELRQPSLQELDKAAPNNPVFLNGSYGGVINTAAIKVSGLDKIKGHEGLIVDPKDGSLTGVINASAFKLLKIPPKKKLTPQEEIEALKKMFHEYNKLGITGVISGYGSLKNYNRFKELSQNNELTIRVMQNFGLPFDASYPKEQMVDSLKSFPLSTGDGDEWVRTGSLKVFLDGGILTGTAYLSEPWGETAMKVYKFDDPEYRGIVNYSQEDIERIAAAAAESGWAFTAHCTGGGGVNLLLDAFGEINQETSITDKRFSIIHGNFFTDEAIEKMQELGVVANVQPAWFYKDADAMKYILGEERVKTFNPYKSLMEHGVVVSGGSDHMVKLDANSSINPYNPFIGMWSSITRKTERGNVVVPEEAISREYALRMYTINNAWSSLEENLKGSIEVGKLADLAVLSNDILTCPVDQIKEIRSEMTMVGGKVVYSLE